MSNITNCKSVTFIDIETTNLDPTRSAILSLAVIKDWMGDGKKQEVWSTKIKPKEVEMRFASKEALEICRYNEEEWADAPTFREVAPKIAEALAWGPIVAHNINFDLSHIRAVMARYGWRETDLGGRLDLDNHIFKVGYPLIDTCALSFVALPTNRQNLDTIREHLNIEIEGGHEALKDAEDCREVFWNIVSKVHS